MNYPKLRPIAYSTVEEPPVTGLDTWDGLVVAYVKNICEWHERTIERVRHNPDDFPLWSPTPRIKEFQTIKGQERRLVQEFVDGVKARCNAKNYESVLTALKAELNRVEVKS